jgi:hypothetical protein
MVKKLQETLDELFKACFNHIEELWEALNRHEDTLILRNRFNLEFDQLIEKHWNDIFQQFEDHVQSIQKQ